MKLREFTDEDITLHALSNGGRNIRNMFLDIKRDYVTLTQEYSSTGKHKTNISVMQSKISELIDRVINMHDICRNSEDDRETRDVAAELKELNSALHKMFDLL